MNETLPKETPGRKRLLDSIAMPHSGERYRNTLDHLKEGFQIIDREYRYVYLNPAAARHGQSTPEALVGRTMMEAYPGIDRTPFFRVLKRCIETNSYERMENLFTHPSGGERWFELRIDPLPDGVCIHSVDIHDEKMAHDALREENHELERRVNERTAALEMSNRELEAFAYSVSHDLRAPLRAIDGFSQILLEDNGEHLDEPGRKNLGRIRAATQKMATLIDDLLALSRVTRSDVDRSTVDVTRFARALLDGYAEREPARVVKTNVEEGLAVNGDAALVRVVLDNLLANAWKFTSREAEGEIRVYRDGTAIVVEDNGVGFDMKFGHQLFTPFRRLHGERDFPGSGIGLATVARIVKKHGGNVRAEGHVGAGAKITFDLGR